ncbi:TPA: hypothetical protein ACITN2_004342 [Salmonella enterica subsp. enterica serovar Virchow]
MTKEESAKNIEQATQLIYKLIGGHCSEEGGEVIGQLLNNTARIADALERIADSLDGKP